MSTTTTCDQCNGRICDPSRQITVSNLCTPSGIMLARDFDFCGPDCFWAWTRKWPVPRAAGAGAGGERPAKPVEVEYGTLHDTLITRCGKCGRLLRSFDRGVCTYDSERAKQQTREAALQHAKESPDCVPNDDR